tara:strand:- start:1237 stop:1488 length:252 start_codon:yes stop_codon:yes gene_type:complete
MKVSAAQILPLIALYLYWIISDMHNRFKHLIDVNPMAKPKIKNMILIENTQIINNPNQISKSKLILSNRSNYLKRLKRGRPKV